MPTESSSSEYYLATSNPDEIELNLPDIYATTPSGSNYSTGNTPSPNHRSNLSSPDSDMEYSPPQATTLLPGHPRAESTRDLLEKLDLVFSITGGEQLTPGDYGVLKAILLNGDYTHEDFSAGLIHAAAMVDGVRRELDARTGREIDSSSSLGNDCGGFVTGMPLCRVAWEDVGMGMLGTISTMGVKSGILQAYEAVHVIKGAIVKASSPLSESEGESMDIDSDGSSGKESGGDTDNKAGSEESFFSLSKSKGETMDLIAIGALVMRLTEIDANNRCALTAVRCVE